MYLHTEASFLTKGSTQIPKGPWVAVGIHCSSEVDLFDCHGFRCGVRSVVPVDGTNGAELRAVRFPLTPFETIAPATAAQWGNPLDGNTRPGEKLVAVLYEKCDLAFGNPGPRVPYETSFFGKLNQNQVATTKDNAALIFRLPFSGRRQASIYLLTDVADSFVVFRAIKYGVKGMVGGGVTTGITNFMEPPVDDVWAGAVAQPVSQVYTGTPIELSRGFNIGGGGDNQEPIDELQVFAYSATQPNILVANATVFGERLE